MPSTPPGSTPRRSLRRSVLVAGAAVVATGLAVSSGVAAEDPGSASATLTTAPSFAVAVDSDLSERQRSASRSDQRSPTKAAKNLARSQRSGGQATRTADLTQGDPRTIARAMLADFGFGASEFSCLDALYESESGWDPHADNPSSTAYGIPQALTGGTHDDLPADYKTNPASQIRWGLQYIKNSYGTPCGAWSFKQSNNWY